MMQPKVPKGEVFFTACIAVYVLVLTFFCFGYTAESRLFPFLVIIPTIIFLVLRFLSIMNPKLSGVLEPDASMIDLEKVQQFAKTVDKQGTAVKKSSEMIVILWVISLVLLTYLFGILPAIALFIFFFVMLYGKKKIVVSVAYTVASWIFIYIIFVVVLQARLYNGILGKFLL
jgi:hypothetical protein